MTHWLDEYTPLRVMPKTIAAADYNLVRLGLLRRRTPLRLQLPRPRCLLAILEADAWVCVDECQNAVPILAWTGFKVHRRTALDAPVECELRLFHLHAGLVMGTALDAIAEAMAEHRRSHRPDRLPVTALRG
jgi:hypothetical protein